MPRFLAVFTMAMLLTGCNQEKQVSRGPSLEEQQRKQMKKELDRVQSEIKQNVQQSMTAGQNAINAAKPRARR